MPFFTNWTTRISYICLCLLCTYSKAQLYGSNFLNALRGYGTDTCRFVSCPFGQYCLNGVCQVSTAAGLPYGGVGAGGYGAGLGAFGGGLLGAANKMCAETVDCYSGQTCVAGRCTFTTGAYGGALGAGMGAYGLYEPGYAGAYSPYSTPYGGYNALATLIDRPAGIMMCSLIQDCPNGQICVNGYCSQSNVAYGGSQAIKQPTISSVRHGSRVPSGPVLRHGYMHTEPAIFYDSMRAGYGVPVWNVLQPGSVSAQHPLRQEEKMRPINPISS